jgi:hypothetical protein
MHLQMMFEVALEGRLSCALVALIFVNAVNKHLMSSLLASRYDVANTSGGRLPTLVFLAVDNRYASYRYFYEIIK